MAAVGGGDERRAPAAGVVAGARALDLDHVGAEVGQDLPGPRPGQDAGELQHAQTGQRTRHGQFLQLLGGLIVPRRVTEKAVYLSTG